MTPSDDILPDEEITNVEAPATDAPESDAEAPEGAPTDPPEGEMLEGGPTEPPPAGEELPSEEKTLLTLVGKAQASGEAAGLEHLQGVLESLLFVSDKALNAKRLAELSQAPLEQVRVCLDALCEFYRPRGFQLVRIGENYQFRTAAFTAPFVRDFKAQKPLRMSRAQLETLAIVAYRQPITRPEIDEVRGVDSGAALKVLGERDLVKILGRKEEAGRPLMYGTTPYFLQFFGLANLRELPTLREFSELTQESKALFARRLGEQAIEFDHLEVQEGEKEGEEASAEELEATSELAETPLDAEGGDAEAGEEAESPEAPPEDDAREGQAEENAP